MVPQDINLSNTNSSVKNQNGFIKLLFPRLAEMLYPGKYTDKHTLKRTSIS